MKNIVKPKLTDATKNFKIKTYSYNQDKQKNTKIKFSTDDESFTGFFKDAKKEFKENLVTPKLEDHFKEGQIESFFQQFHIFDDVDETIESSNQTPESSKEDVQPVTPASETPKEEAQPVTPEPSKEEAQPVTPASETPKEEKQPESPKKEEKPETPAPEISKEEYKPSGDGKTTEIPSNISQTGIIANLTQRYGTRGWAYDQKKLADAYKAAGSQQDGNMATINGRYLVAVSPKFGKVGDNIDIQLANGKVIPAVIADVKGSDAQSNWGHVLGGAVDVVEWEINGTSQSELASNLKDKGWYGSKVTSITNTGSGQYF